MRRRIAILGGGPAGLAAAWALTGSAEARERVEVTVYEARDRLGGKCATSRGPGGRIEEHGVHLLQGWYHNAFRMLRAAYEARVDDGTEADPRRRDLSAWFLPQSSMLLTGDGHRADQVLSAFVFPRAKGLPGDGAPGDDLHCLARLAALSLCEVQRIAGLPADEGVLDRRAAILDALARGAGGRAFASALGPEALSFTLAAAAGALGRLARTATLGSAAAGALGLVRVAALLLRGLIEDAWDRRRGALDLERLDDLDLSAWLLAHGADDVLFDEPVVRFFYNVLLTDRTPVAGPRGLSAAAMVRLLLRSADYRGAFYWRTREGTGDGTILPLYQALAARGVRFRFGHRLERLGCSSDRLVDTVDLGLAGDAGPSLGALHGRAVWRGPRRASPPTSPRARLRLGDDFDDVVLAIPPAALEGRVDALVAADPRWAAMLREIVSVPSAHAQLWIRPSLSEVGWDPTAAGAAARDEAVVTTLRRPFQSWADMSHALAAEAWDGADRPRTLLYLTCACDPAWLGAGAEAAFRDALADRLRASPGLLWTGRGAPPPGWPEDALHGPAGARWAAQYVTVNAEPDARYVLALPGTAGARLAPDDAGFENLALAGDWTAGGLQAGCFEGAVTSGFEAADALLDRAGISDRWQFHRYVGARAR